VTPSEAVAPEFLLQALKRLDYAELSSGAAIPMLTVGKLGPIEIPLPPVPEQRRIVRKLNTLSARSITARTHLTAIEKLVERYKVAVLRSAFFVDASGTLNEEEAATCGWDVRPLGQSLENLDNRRIPIKAEDRKKRQGPYDYYGASGVIDKIDEYLFEGRYLLIGEDGANLVARSSPIAFIAEGKFWVNNHAHVLGETHDACLDWVRLYFAAIKLEPFVTGSAQPKLTQANLNKIPVPLPTPEEQREIVRRIETAFANIDRLKAEAAKALKLLGHLDQRILAKAFAGDLVPQDPNDEPAETLLARIREARATTPKGKRGRKAKE
jgi:type I restriction enzyme S subunit